MSFVGIAKMKVKGFTLIEVLVTLALFAIITTSVAPSVNNCFVRNKVAATVNSISSALQFARHTSISENVFVVVCPTNDMENCTGDSDWTPTKMVFVDENNNRQLDDNEEIIGSADIVRDFHIKSTRDEIVFAPVNTAGTTTATISICRKEDINNFARALSISNVGRVSIEKDSAAIDCT